MLISSIKKKGGGEGGREGREREREGRDETKREAEKVPDQIVCAFVVGRQAETAASTIVRNMK